jgi:hypothetical protein
MIFAPDPQLDRGENERIWASESRTEQSGIGRCLMGVRRFESGPVHYPDEGLQSCYCA